MGVKNKEVFYFAYGSNPHTEMIKAIVGRKPEGFDYELKGYELCVQSWKDIPNESQKILKIWWDKSFKSYSLRKNTLKSVYGRIWKLTREERNLVGNWELHNIWYKPIKIKRKINNKIAIIETEMIKNNEMTPVINSQHYPNFLVDKNKILKVAKIVREAYLRSK